MNVDDLYGDRVAYDARQKHAFHLYDEMVDFDKLWERGLVRQASLKLMNAFRHARPFIKLKKKDQSSVDFEERLIGLVTRAHKNKRLVEDDVNGLMLDLHHMHSELMMLIKDLVNPISEGVEPGTVIARGK